MVCVFKGGYGMTYWEAAYILEHGSVHYGKVLEATRIALMVLKERIKKLDEAKDAEFRETDAFREQKIQTI